MAIEHEQLITESSDTFDAKIAKRIGELKSVAEALREWENTRETQDELQKLFDDPTTEAELRELASEDLVATVEDLDLLSRKLSTALTPKHPFEDMPCLIEVRPGAGGSEAAIFAADLLRMYQSYCTRRNLRSSVLKYETQDGDSSDSPALAEAILEIDSPGAYGQLRSEAGVHRVQRVPATEQKGRTHTSAVGVLVLPSLPAASSDGKEMWEEDMNDPNSDYYVNSTDVKTDVMRARGAGGQHVNTTDSAVRLTHIPTNTVVSMQDSRSQHKNREKAWQVLRSKLAQARREAREEEVMKLRRGVIGVAKMGRGDKVRTYNWGQQRVTDHRSGLSVHNLDDVMEGGDELDKIIGSVRTWFSDREIEGMLAEEEAATSST
ncbi:probable peptide chain release factor 1 [Rhynchosporium agropyri]|uniref:Probable peptide chain release factor 1 n=2 Tax=Rhynchosporium TaxID=38037 RepID=A0A1E1L636_9HELO|nr:probable peptide chain release factor 1 [Rhynchosporium commune]CZT05098.1 probable peptide chain release factor 1 [Rhynchosporium agropyri]